jgi:hypothetical protein
MRDKLFLISLPMLAAVALACAVGGGKEPTPTPAPIAGPQPTRVPTLPPASATTEEPREEGERSLTIVDVRETLETRPSEDAEFEAAYVGQGIPQGTQIQSTGKGSANLEFDDGTLMRVDEKTTVTLVELGGSAGAPVTRFVLDAGRLYFVREGAAREGAHLDVETPVGTASALGTIMSVDYNAENDTLTITCLGGTCTVSNEAGEVTTSKVEHIVVVGDGAPSNKGAVPGQWFQAWQDTGLIDVSPIAGEEYGSNLDESVLYSRIRRGRPGSGPVVAVSLVLTVVTGTSLGWLLRRREPR